LSPVLQVDRDEWEAFRSEFSELTKNYELVLSKLKQAQAEVKTLSEENEALRRAGSNSPSTGERVGLVASGVEEVKRAQSDKPDKQGLDFWESIRRRLIVLGKPRFTSASNAACRRCGFPVREASWFCSGCGTDFGGLICPCGRELSRGDKYCDRCGRKPQLH